MIALLTGTLAIKEADRVVVRTTSGVGYECFLPTRALADLPNPGQPVELHTSLVVREDGQSLYGFTTAEERRVFQRLLQASGIGPRLALAMLSQEVLLAVTNLQFAEVVQHVSRIPLEL